MSFQRSPCGRTAAHQRYLLFPWVSAPLPDIVDGAVSNEVYVIERHPGA